MSPGVPITTKTLAKDAGLDEILKKIDGFGSLEDSLLILGSTETLLNASADKTLTSPIPRLDNDPHVFLGPQGNVATKQGVKPLFIPDFVSLGTYNTSDDEQEIWRTGGAKIVIRAAKGKPKLENISLSIWVATNSRTMHELMIRGKLSTNTSDIADYLAYTVKFARLLETHTFASTIAYDNEYGKLRSKYGFRWGSNLQHLHTRFLIKHRSQPPPTNTSSIL